MNGLLVVSGGFALFTTIGHFVIGSKRFLQPMMGASFDPVAKKVMHCVFHYVSAFLILSTLALLAVGLGVQAGDSSQLLIRFISVNFGAFALWQIALASTAGIPRGVFKLFQWMLFVVIAVFGWLGA